jgi:hypothetical protein
MAFTFKFTDYISPLWFFIALFITLLLVNIMAPEKKIVVKEVNLENHQDLVFRKSTTTEDGKDSCYKYKKEETTCKQ